VWAADHKLAAFPVEGVYLTLYLQHLAEVKGSKAAVEEAVNSLSWAHNLAGITPPSASPIVQVALEEPWPDRFARRLLLQWGHCSRCQGKEHVD